MTPGPIVLGRTNNVKDILKSSRRDREFLFEDVESDLVRVFNKAGSGWYVQANSDCASAGVDIRGCQAVAVAVRKGKEEFFIEILQVFMFRNERTAESQMDEAEDLMEENLPDDREIIEVKQDGVFVLITISVEKDDLDF